MIAILPDNACGVVESARVLGYLAVEAAGQCGPCTNGLGALAGAVMQMAQGRAGPRVEDDIARWSAVVPGRGACHHPDGAVRFALSALNVFAEELAEHRRRGRPIADHLLAHARRAADACPTLALLLEKAEVPGA